MQQMLKMAKKKWWFCSARYEDKDCCTLLPFLDTRLVPDKQRSPRHVEVTKEGEVSPYHYEKVSCEHGRVFHI